VPRMQQVKDAIGEDDPAPSSTPGCGGLERADLRGGVQSGCVVRGWKEKVWLKKGSDTVSL
jgi:hypothetical protein